MPETLAVMEVSSDWAAAREVQQRFMTYRAGAAATQAMDISARCRQVQELGGDFYDFMPFPDGRLAMAIGDASGKGVAAALMMANVQSSLRTAAVFTSGEGAAAVEAVNRQVYASSLAERYATLFYGVFSADARRLHYVNAGHHTPMILHADGSVTWLETGGAPVGMFADWSYDEGELALEAGDVLVVSTDGVTEAANPAGEEWGVDGVREAAFDSNDKNAAQMVHEIFSAMDRLTLGRQSDDATVVVLKVR